MLRGNIDGSKIDRGKAGQAAAARRDGGNVANRAGAASKATGAKGKNIHREVKKPRPGGQVQKRSGKNSAIGNVSSKRHTQISSNRGRQSMSGGGHRRPQAMGGHRGGGGHARPHRGGGGRGGRR